MKVDRNKSLRQNLHLNRKTSDKPLAVKGGFKRALHNATEIDITTRLDNLMELIEEKAKKLKKNISLKNLSEYRHYVKQFLKLFSEEFMNCEQMYSWERGSMKSFTKVRDIDENLEELRGLFMEEQKDSLKIIEKLDVIRGMLLDLYI